MIIDKHIDKYNWDEIKDILPQITVIASLDLSEMKLTELPKMSHITINGSFNCSYNQITSYKDCPIVNGSFNCSFNQIKSFKYCPNIKGDFWCYSNQIKSFKYCPNIKGDFSCSLNQIISFKDCPLINGDFYCHDNQITSFKDCPEIRGYFHSDYNIFEKVLKYSKEKIISLLGAQVELHNQQDEELFAHLDKFPDLVAYIRMKELNKLL